MIQQKNILISGTTSGIGRATALRLARENHNIITLNRPGSREEKAFQELQATGTGAKHRYFADLSTARAVREAAAEIAREIPHLDVLINNAGVFQTKERLSKDNTELTFAVNVRAPVIITGTLLPLLKKANSGRVLFVSSELYKRANVNGDNPFSIGKFKSSNAYAHSKMLVSLLAEVLAENYPEVDYYSLHPGVIATEVFRGYPKIISTLLNKMLPGPDKAAELLSSLALESQKEPNGSYFMENAPTPLVKPPQAEQVKAQLLEYFKNQSA